MSVENYLPGDLCSGLIICWRKSSGEMSPGEKFLGEICDEFVLSGLISVIEFRFHFQRGGGRF